MRTFAFWAYLFMWGILLYAFLGSAWNYLKAWDLKFNKEEAQRHNRKADMKQAHAAAIILPQLAVPLGLIVIALMAYNLYRPAVQWWEIYTIISVYWFISAPFRRFWVIYTAIRVDKRLREKGERKDSEGQAHKVYKPGEALHLYYQNGIRSQRRRSVSAQSMLFVGRLKWLNKVAWLWRWIRYTRLMVPVLAEGLMSLFWPFTATIMTLVHSAQAAEPPTVHPWWERGY
jgi:hypothetical protein